MSGPKGIQYTVEQIAEIQEARNLEREKSRLRVAEQELGYLREDCARFAESYGDSVDVDAVPAATGRENSAGLVRIAAAVEAIVGSGRRRLASSIDRARQQRLIERMLELYPELPKPTRTTESVSAPPAAPPVTVSTRVADALALLEEGVELSDEFTRLAVELAAPGAADDGALLRALQAEVVRLNREDHQRAKLLAALRDLDVRVGAIPAAVGAKAMVAAAIFAARSANAVDLFMISAAVDEAEVLARADSNRSYVRSKVGEILVSLGYQNAPGFETVIPHEGRLVRKPGWSQHGVLVDVADGEISLTVVRTATEGDPAISGARDVQAETEMCDDLPSILHDIEASGIHAGRVRDIPPGIYPVRVLANAAPVPAAEVRRARPKEREL